MASNESLTPRDIQLIISVMHCNKNDIAIDYKKFAALNGFATLSGATGTWSTLKKKLDAIGKNQSANPTATPPSGKGKKRKATKPSDGDDGAAIKDEDGDPTPTKKKTTSKGRGKKVKDEPTEEADDAIFADFNFDETTE